MYMYTSLHYLGKGGECKYLHAGLSVIQYCIYVEVMACMVKIHVEL